MSEIFLCCLFLLLLLLLFFFFVNIYWKIKIVNLVLKIVGTYIIFLEKIKITFEVFEKLLAQVQNVKYVL